MIIGKGEKIFKTTNCIIMLIVMAIIIIPLLYILSASLSSGNAVVCGKVGIIPCEFTITAYEKVFEDKQIWIGYANTIFYTVFGTVISMFLSVCGAYPLSKKRLGARRFLSFFISITMWFNVGMIPTYLNIKSFGLLDSRLAVLIPFAVSAFNVIILRTAFSSIPDSLEEAAYIDGAHDFTVLMKIYIPLILPSLLTVWLFYAIERWNGYLWSMILLKSEQKQPLQVILSSLITDLRGTADDKQVLFDSASNYSEQTVTYATIVVSILPMLLVYPYIQKYFVKSVVVGAVK